MSVRSVGKNVAPVRRDSAPAPSGTKGKKRPPALTLNNDPFPPLQVTVPKSLGEKRAVPLPKPASREETSFVQGALNALNVVAAAVSGAVDTVLGDDPEELESLLVRRSPRPLVPSTERCHRGEDRKVPAEQGVSLMNEGSLHLIPAPALDRTKLVNGEDSKVASGFLVSDEQGQRVLKNPEDDWVEVEDPMALVAATQGNFFKEL